MTIMTETLTPTLNYKVADITLAEFGNKEISQNMKYPTMAAVKIRTIQATPDVKIMGSLHMTIQTAV